MHALPAKVETIGIAYMFASGVPMPNGKHTMEVSMMSLDFPAMLLTFEIQVIELGHRVDIIWNQHSIFSAQAWFEAKANRLAGPTTRQGGRFNFQK